LLDSMGDITDQQRSGDARSSLLGLRWVWDLVRRRRRTPGQRREPRTLRRRMCTSALPTCRVHSLLADRLSCFFRSSSDPDRPVRVHPSLSSQSSGRARDGPEPGPKHAVAQGQTVACDLGNELEGEKAGHQVCLQGRDGYHASSSTRVHGYFQRHFPVSPGITCHVSGVSS
jgi:hypothetical protein